MTAATLASSCTSETSSQALRGELAPPANDQVVGATYYIGTDGRDSNSGNTPSAAWATFSHALAQMAVGDTLLVLDGDFRENFVVDKAVAIRASGGLSRIWGDGSTLINITGRGATVDGLIVEHTAIRAGRDNLVEITASDVIVRNCQIRCSAIVDEDSAHESRSAGDRRAGIRVQNETKNIQILDCEIFGTCFGIHIPTGSMFNSVIRGCEVHHTVQSAIVIQSEMRERGLLIEDCKLNYSYIEDGIQFQQSGRTAISNFGTYVRNCHLIGNRENALDTKGVGSLVVEGCIMSQAFGSNDGNYRGWNDASYSTVMIGTGAECANVIMRNNVIYNSSGGIYQSGDNWKSYNNTIIYNNFTPQGPQVDQGSKPVAFQQREVVNIGMKNNLVGGHRYCQVVAQLSNELDIDHNLYFAGLDGGSALVGAVGTTVDRSGQPLEWREWQAMVASSNVGGKERHSKYFDDHKDVGFANVPAVPTGLPEQYDFSVRPDSPAYRAGGALTAVTAVLDPQAVVVADSTWLSDGLGATQGDTIMIGSRLVQIRSIDENVLTIDRPIDADVGDLVYWGPSNQPHIGIINM